MKTEDRPPSVGINRLSFVPIMQWRKIYSGFLGLEYLKYFPTETSLYLADRYLHSANAKPFPINHGLWELWVSKVLHELSRHVQANTRPSQPQLVLSWLGNIQSQLKNNIESRTCSWWAATWLDLNRWLMND